MYKQGPFSLCLLVFITTMFLLKVFLSEDRFPSWSFYTNILIYVVFLLFFASAVLINPGIPDRNRKPDSSV